MTTTPRPSLRSLASFACLIVGVFAVGVIAQPAAEPAPDSKQDAKPDAKPAKWDVSNPPGLAHDVPIDTTTGTWMNLDVSPDGRTIVFDLLGDIYTMPISGGDATPLTSGMAWDMQPRFSPDGRWIAFTSDRAGGDNIWIMNADGSDPKQVTKEDFRLPTSPVWTPDSEFIAARKHFVSKRSLGAGEIWLYHRTGGAGVQMVARPTDQKDLGEPAFSPDGRYLYYSLDATPGQTFQYNKDSNDQIYVISRLDRQTGRSERLIDGAGGAIRPTPSPDGKTIAYLRRVRFQTNLYLYDIATGMSREIHRGMERDMQEAWAIHGVYPTIAWTPDGENIVFWAGGKIRRLNIETGSAEIIPFRVRDTRRVLDTVRSPQPVAPDTFHTKMLRWTAVSPDGSRVAFQTLGKIYVRDLPDGRVRRLTQQNEHDEFYPSWSRDGRSIVYTTWHDESLGSVRVAPAAGGAGRAVTTEPGHYVEPVFSPDGSTIVFRKAGGGFLTTPAYSSDTGVYKIPAAGGEMELVTRSGSAPQFAADNDRVYLMRVTPGRTDDERRLVSVDLHGNNEMKHFVSGNAVQYAVSPDGRWVAFTEKHRAYIAPFVRSGQEVSIGPDTRAFPVARVSVDTGDFLHFAGDSSTLHWSLGPELFSRPLLETFAFLEGAGDEPAEPVAAGLDIGFDSPKDTPTGVVAILGARIITMGDAGVIEDGAVVIDGDRIAAVGPRSDVRIPAGAHVIDARGATIVPGFIDAHAHGGQGSSGFIPGRNWTNDANLAFGVTTIHDPSNDTHTFFAASEMQRAGLIAAPRLFSTGTILYGAFGSFRAVVNNADDALSHLRRMQKVGAFSVKSYNQPRRDQRQQIIQAARELNMLVVPEGGSTFMHNMTMLIDGHTSVEHNIPVRHAYDDVLQLWAGTATGYTPTHVVSYGGMSGEYYWYDKTNVWENERLLRFVPRSVVDPRSRRRQTAPDEEYNHISAAAIGKQLSDRGIYVNIGAHGQLAGLAAHWEIWMAHQGGMSELEALATATINPARHFGFDADLGSVEPGKLADLLILDADPLENIFATQRIRTTILGGRIYDAATLNQQGNHPDTAGDNRYGPGANPISSHHYWHSVAEAAAEAEGVGCSCGRH